MGVAVALLGALSLGATDSRTHRVTNAEDAPGDLSVVGLVYDGRIACSGTLISSRVVLTAAHCLYYGTPSSARVVDSSGRIMTEIRVAQTLHHPGFDPESLSSDIGAVLLERPAPPAIPRLRVGTAQAPVTGTELRLVGFGQTRRLASDGGVRRQGRAVVDEVDAFAFRYSGAPSQACVGDSGGPALATVNGVERLVGVISHGDAYCQSYGVNTRVDAHLTGFILPALDAVEAHGQLGSPVDGGCGSAPNPGRGTIRLILVCLMVVGPRRLYRLVS